MRANSSVLVLRLVWQTSLATLPFCRRPLTAPCLRMRPRPAQCLKNGRVSPKCCQSMYFVMGKRRMSGKKNLQEQDLRGLRDRNVPVQNHQSTDLERKTGIEPQHIVNT